MSSSISSISDAAPRGVERSGVQRIESAPLRGVLRSGVDVTVDELRRVTSPKAAEKTIHWGRNYLYQARLATGAGELPVVVKIFREESARRRLQRRFKGSKAHRCFTASLAMLEAGVAVPEPVAALESSASPGASYFLYRPVDDALEARYFFRARNAGAERQQFPDISVDLLLARLGAMLRSMHDARLWHRDVSAGNVLLEGDWSGRAGTTAGELYLIDLARTRSGKRLTISERMRDLARLPLHRAEDRAALLRSYAAGEPSSLERRLLALHHHAFHLRHRAKDRLRGLRRALPSLRSRGAHPHIPQAAEGAAVRERVVWDPLSDQPHLHAGRTAKLRTRLADAGIHAREAAVLLRRAPAVAVRFRALQRELDREQRGERSTLMHHRPAEVGGIGVGLSGGSAPGRELVAEVEALGVRRVLLRLQPWENELARDAELARELRALGCDVVLAVAQNRDLVRDRAQWRAALEEIAGRFAGLATHVQIGHAINRSKWGVWNQREYAELVGTAAEVFGQARGTGTEDLFKIVGPGVIDFELYATCIALNWPENAVRLDAVTSLLYVDRRGAPENRQAGLEAVDKATLLRAIIQTSRHGDRESWITEVNWPLHEGPHSPAGRHVSVSEEAQASYLARYYLLMLGSGMVERVYWWQLVARGYGLVDRDENGLRRRPSWRALAFLERALSGCKAWGPGDSEPPFRAQRFERPDGRHLVAVWTTTDQAAQWKATFPVRHLFDRDGRELSVPADGSIRVDGSPVYAEIDVASID